MFRFIKRLFLFFFLILSLYLFFNEIYSYHEPIDTILYVDDVIKSSTTVLGIDWEMVLYYVNVHYEVNDEIYSSHFISPYEYHQGDVKRVLVDSKSINILWYEEMIFYSVMLFFSFFLFVLDRRKMNIDKQLNGIGVNDNVVKS